MFLELLEKTKQVNEINEFRLATKMIVATFSQGFHTISR